MIRIAGVTLPNKKRMAIALTYIYGIGRSKALSILKQARIDENMRSEALTEKEEGELRRVLDTIVVEGDLRREVNQNIKMLKEINCYRGTRHKKGLPVRGQRTKTNSRTAHGNTRKTMGSGRSKSAAKT